MVRGQNDMCRSGGLDSGNAHISGTDCICICKIGSKMTCAGLERSPALVGQILELGALRGGGIALVEASLIILVRWIFTTLMNSFYGYDEENTLENLYGCNEENI